MKIPACCCVGAVLQAMLTLSPYLSARYARHAGATQETSFKIERGLFLLK
jgi:hypothetical protein